MATPQMKNTEEERQEYARILDRMRHLCSVREYCTADIRRKIMKMLSERTGRDGKAEDAEEIIGRMLGSLQSDGYLSDTRYAIAFARDKSSLSGWGAVKIKYALGAKGIDGGIIRSALEEIDKDRASDRLERLVAAKYRSLAPNLSDGKDGGKGSDKDGGNDSGNEIRMKIIRYAMGRGYGYDETISVLQKVLSAGKQD